MAQSHDETAQHGGCPFTGNPQHNTPLESSNTCLDVIEALDGLFTLEKRSATLEGSVPLKAAQFCKPFIAGNAAGFHLRFADSAVIQKGRNGAMLRLTDEGYVKATEGYALRIEHLVERGTLVKGSYWHQQLSKGFAWQKNNKLYLWTGHLIRPAPGVWMLMSGAYNRRCPVNLDEYVIPDEGAFVPLILPLDLASVRAKGAWLEKELACLTPLRPHVGFTRCTLTQAPEVGRAFCDHFDARYAEAGPGKYVGGYRKLTARETTQEADRQAACQLVIVGGPPIHKFRTFDRFATASGLTRRYPAKHRLQFAVVHSICDVKGRWDGHAVRNLTAEMPEAVQRLRDTWTALYGADKLTSLDMTLTDYAHYTHGPQIGEPYLVIIPWVFAVTPPGWSSIIDGCHVDDLEGLRGVISTDSYFAALPVWQFIKPCRFTFRRGTPLIRILPVPRRLLQATFRTLSLNDDELNKGLSSAVSEERF